MAPISVAERPELAQQVPETQATPEGLPAFREARPIPTVGQIQEELQEAPKEVQGAAGE